MRTKDSLENYNNNRPYVVKIGTDYSHGTLAAL